jgi:hypothetical protein
MLSVDERGMGGIRRRVEEMRWRGWVGQVSVREAKAICCSVTFFLTGGPLGCGGSGHKIKAPKTQLLATII